MSKRRKPTARKAGRPTAGSLNCNAFSLLDVLIVAPFERRTRQAKANECYGGRR
jgi:hypothetical protein